LTKEKSSEIPQVSKEKLKEGELHTLIKLEKIMSYVETICKGIFLVPCSSVKYTRESSLNNFTSFINHLIAMEIILVLCNGWNC